MHFSSKGMIPLMSAVFLLTACGGGGGGSSGSVGTGGTPAVGDSSSISSSSVMSSSSSSVKPLVKTVAKEEFFSIYGFYPGMYKLTLGAAGDFEERTVDARILMNEIWNPSVGRWSFQPVIDWCGDLASSNFVAESIEQGDFPAGKFYILNSRYSGGDDKYVNINLNAEVVNPKVIKGTRYLSVSDVLQTLTLTWQSDEMNYTFGYADFTTSNKNVPKVESTSVCYSTRQEKDELTGELLSVDHQGYILVPRKPEDGGLVVASVGEYIAKFQLSTDYDLETTDKQLGVWLELWGFGVGDWQAAFTQSGDSVIDVDALTILWTVLSSNNTSLT